MSDEKVLKFPEKPVPARTVAQQDDEQSVDSLVRQLNEAHARGEVTNLVWTYTDKDRGVMNGISANMSVRDFSFHVAVLQERLMRWIGQS